MTIGKLIGTHAFDYIVLMVNPGLTSCEDLAMALCKKQHCYNRAHVMGFTEDWLKYHQIKRKSQIECHKAFKNYVYC